MSGSTNVQPDETFFVNLSDVINATVVKPQGVGTILSNPGVTTNPISQIVSAGNPVSFVAAASGVPTPTVQWQVSTNAGNSFSNIAGATSTTLTFNTTAAENGDEYRAVFSDSSGTATSAPATLTVNSTQGGLVISATNGVFPQISLAPQGQYGNEVFTLSNGNIVVLGGVGVLLYNGETGALISSLARLLRLTTSSSCRSHR